jgi:hypothetical protein
MERTMIRLLTATCVASIVSSLALAQEADVTGEYWGGFNGRGSGARVSIILNVQSVTDGRVKAIAQRTTASGRAVMHVCDGEYPLRGRLEHDHIRLRETASGGRSDECRMHITGTFQGNSLVGHFGQNDLTLSK